MTFEKLATNYQTSIAPGLHALLLRLEKQSLEPDFASQRELSLSFSLRPYLEVREDYNLAPLLEEIQLARLYLYSDYFPTDGHPTLIEQIRDLITEHVPQEERDWLDAVRHSYLDLLEVLCKDTQENSPILILRSLGDGQEFRVNEDILFEIVQPHHILLTRLIRRPDCLSFPGVAIVLSETLGETLFTLTNDERRQLEARSGELALGEWSEFMKQYGYICQWNLARVRRGALSIADAQVRYCNSKGEPYLYAIAIYEHPDPSSIKNGIEHIPGFKRTVQSEHAQEESVGIWEKERSTGLPDTSGIIQSRFTLTPTQLIVETNSAEHLDELKHELARRFGFILHFRGEVTTPPNHIPPEVDLLSDSFHAQPLTVSLEEEQAMLKSFLESVFLDWAERPCPVLYDESPRHVAVKGGKIRQVATLIDQMEQHDLAFRRTGTRGYDYNILRGHVGV